MSLQVKKRAFWSQFLSLILNISEAICATREVLNTSEQGNSVERSATLLPLGVEEGTSSSSSSSSSSS
jgi:hypothetical protein